jgi:hypothetical protein
MRIADWALAKLQNCRIQEYEIAAKSAKIPQSALRIPRFSQAFPHGGSDLERPKPGGMVMEMSRDH